MYEKLVNLYTMKSMVMFWNFIAKKTENDCNPSLLIYLSRLSPFILLWSHWKQIMASQMKKRNGQMIKWLDIKRGDC